MYEIRRPPGQNFFCDNGDNSDKRDNCDNRENSDITKVL